MISFIFSFKLWLRKVVAILYLLIVALISLMPAQDLPHITIYAGFDKVVHFGMYLGLAFLVSWSFVISHKHMAPVYLLLTGVFMWGVLMEILQRTMQNGRNFEFRDMLANLAGAIAGILVFRYLDRKRIELEEKRKVN